MTDIAYRCKWCERFFLNCKAFQIHIIDSHWTEREGDDNNQFFKCKYCHVLFDDRRSLQKHKLISHWEHMSKIWDSDAIPEQMYLPYKVIIVCSPTPLPTRRVLRSPRNEQPPLDQEESDPLPTVKSIHRKRSNGDQPSEGKEVELQAKRRHQVDQEFSTIKHERVSPIPDPDTSTHSQSSIVKKAVKVFFLNVKDTKILKTCRLVSKAWNRAACKALKVQSVITLKEGSPNLINFQQLLLSRACGPMSHLTTFIQNLHVQGQTFTDPMFWALLKLPGTIAIKYITIKFENSEPKLNKHFLSRILVDHKENLTNMNIIVDENFDVEDFPLEPEEFLLTSVKNLTVVDSCVKCNHQRFFKNILSKAIPENIALNIKDGQILRSLLSKDNVKSLAEMKLLLSGNISAMTREHLARLPFNNLQKLTFKDLSGNETFDRHTLTLFIKNLWRLQFFSSNVPISTAPELIFSNLRTIEMSNNNLWASLTPKRFPCLTSIICWVTSTDLQVENFTCPHEGVGKITIRIAESCATSSSLDKSNLLSMFNYIGRQFPNLRHLYLSMKEFCDTTIMDICTTFRGLKVLYLDGGCDFFGISGIQNQIFSKYSEMGLPIHEIPRRKSILDFTGLESLSLSQRFAVEPRTIKHCLSKIPQLTRLRFYWNESLSPNVIWTSLDHLKKVTIACLGQPSEELIRLERSMTNVELKVVKIQP